MGFWVFLGEISGVEKGWLAVGLDDESAAGVVL